MGYGIVVKIHSFPFFFICDVKLLFLLMLSLLILHDTQFVFLLVFSNYLFLYLSANSRVKGEVFFSLSFIK